MNSPSKHLSVKFLARLRGERYCSHDTLGNIKEYCQVEVDNMFFDKLNRQCEGMRFERQFNDTTGNNSIDSFTDMLEFFNVNYNNAMFQDMNNVWNTQLGEL